MIMLMMLLMMMMMMVSMIMIMMMMMMMMMTVGMMSDECGCDEYDEMMIRRCTDALMMTVNDNCVS